MPERSYDAYDEETLLLWSKMEVRVRQMLEEIQQTYEKSGGKGVIFSYHGMKKYKT